MLEKLLRFENLSDELVAIKNDVRSGIPTAVFGVTFSEKCHMAANFGLPILYIVKDSVSARRIVEEMSAFAGEEVVFLQAKDDVLLYKSAFDKTGLYNRLNALYKIRSGAKFVVTTFDALLQLFPKELPVITLKTSGNYDLYNLIESLVGIGYRREEFAEDKGTFAVRGDIFEIFPINGEHIYRVDFFGNEAETIKRYYPDDKANKEIIKGFDIVPATDVLIKDCETDGIKTRIKNSVLKFKTAEARAAATVISDELTDKLEEDKSADRLQFVMPITENVTDDVFCYMPTDTVVVFDECKMLADNLSAVQKEHTERYLSMIKAGKAFDFTVLQFGDGSKLIDKIKEHRLVAFQNITTAVNFFNPIRTYSVKCSPVPRYSAKPDDLFTDVGNWKFGGYKVIICCGNSERADRLRDDMYAHGVPVTKSDDPAVKFGTAVVSSEFLPTGFIYHGAKTVVIGTGDVYIGQGEKKRIKRKRGDLFQAPEVGDFAVHEVHGIGYVKGVTRITTQEGSKDYVAVEYYGGDTLYVGVDSMDKLTKYVGGEKPTLNKIGGKEFDRIKERARASISAMTINLKKLYQARKEKKGFVYSKDNELTEEFAEAFEFEPTEDQVQSVEEISKDMESEKVMDRLLCGDVGFGKTEVAFRAVFKAVMDGKQAALVCPTTILCEQHYMSAVKRFEGFGVRICALNRFKSAAEQQKIIAGLENGDVDFVIGTHRLFGKDVKFKDLGLLVLDEEQRFGVEHKEKLKLLKDNVDTLTMTATPIPRTLHMSLSGIRDISVINTPPKIRIPVQTYVTEESEVLIKDAVTRELARGGQVLVLYNRVETILKFSEEFRRIVPEARVIVAHGQMDKKSLEDSVFGFYNGNADVLIATTIIENGIDLPRANTLIVIDSDRMGLSTLYQLKGRVGRSNVMAHAYFTFKREKVLSESAYKRLNALMEFTEMGSGYKIAMRDLEIRGAGNVLGREQHGHMDRIGYELYNKLLKESLGEVTKDFDTELDIKMDAYIPDAYISSSPSRMDCYKQIAEIRDAADKSRVITSLEENYGKIPKQIENLILIAELKVAARKHNAVKVTINDKKASVTVNGIDSLKEDGFIDRVNMYKGKVTLAFAENPELVFSVDGKSPEETAKAMLEFMNF